MGDATTTPLSLRVLSCFEWAARLSSLPAGHCEERVALVTALVRKLGQHGRFHIVVVNRGEVRAVVIGVEGGY